MKKTIERTITLCDDSDDQYMSDLRLETNNLGVEISLCHLHKESRTSSTNIYDLDNNEISEVIKLLQEAIK